MTAIEWYFKQMQSKEHFTKEEFDGIYEQAKEMEKQQIIDAIAESNKSNNRNVSLNPEQYYNETFKKNE